MSFRADRSINFIQQKAVAFCFHFRFWDKQQGGAVHAIAKSTFVFGSVIENVPQVAVAGAASDFSPFHEQHAVLVLSDDSWINGFSETRPSGCGVIFI